MSAAPATGPTLTVVLPVHNQSDHIAAVARSYGDVLGHLVDDYELLLVTNACTDASPRICQELAENDPRVRTIDLADQGGWGLAVRAGLADARGLTLCYTNSARTSPDVLALLISYHRVYPEAVVKASRRVRDSWRRRLGSILYNLECRTLFDLAVWDVNGTPKVFRRDHHRALLDARRNDDLLDAEIVAICQREGYRVLDVPILDTRRHGGTSTTDYASAVRMYAGALSLSRQLKRR